MIVREITACRACGSDRLKTVLSLGEHCISDFVDDAGTPDQAPLVLVQCRCCTLVQLRHTVSRDRLYRHYWYRSGTNESMIAALRDVAAEAQQQVALEPGDVVLDIGANDGTLLRMFPRECVRFGFEPAENLYRVASDGGNLICTDFFPAKNIPDPLPAKVITSIAMFYDLEDPNGFVDEIKRWLRPDGVWILQLTDLHSMLAANAFDNICHEHLEYYSARPLRYLLERHGLRIAGMSCNQVNGGSLRLIIRHGEMKEPGYQDARPQRDDLADFALRVQELRWRTLTLLGKLKREGAHIWGYGASTKGNTLLQYYGIDTDLVEKIADRNPEKWGRRTVGTGIPICSEQEMREARPDYLLVLPWHFLDAFRVREADYLARGGQFIVPLPDLRIVGVDHADVQPQAATPESRTPIPA